MAEQGVLTTADLTVEVLTPVHVGAGGPPLAHDYDYVRRAGALLVVDQRRVLERARNDALAADPDARLSRLLRPEDDAHCARYRLPFPGREPPPTVLEHVKDAFDRPYLPGSSLKGALRTALAWHLAGPEGRGLDLRRLHQRNPRLAAAEIERQMFGNNPERDLLRALRPGDLHLVEERPPDLAEVAVYTLRGDALQPKGPGFRWWVETLPPGAILRGTVAVEEFLFAPAASRLDLAGRRALVTDLIAHVRAWARDLIAAELRFYERARQPRIAAFYRQLQERLGALGRDACLLQIAWGTGWLAKTLGTRLRAHPAFEEEVVDRYRLDRGRRAGAFPKTRRLVERGGSPLYPPGWVLLRWSS